MKYKEPKPYDYYDLELNRDGLRLCYNLGRDKFTAPCKIIKIDPESRGYRYYVEIVDGFHQGDRIFAAVEGHNPSFYLFTKFENR